jgi:RNA polymerase sigma-B factor
VSRTVKLKKVNAVAAVSPTTDFVRPSNLGNVSKFGNVSPATAANRVGRANPASAARGAGGIRQSSTNMRVDRSLAAQRLKRNKTVTALFKDATIASESERERIQQQVVLEYLDVAEAVARRFTTRQQEWSDIRQVACVGLVKAARRFDSSRGDDFVSFAVPTISGEIKRHLRDNGWFIRPPRRIQELRSILLAEVPRLTQQLGRDPEPEEIARDLGETVDRVTEAIDCQESLRPVSLDLALHDDGLTLGDTIGDVDRELERAELTAMLRAACDQLTPRQQRIVYLRFFHEQTQAEIAAELGVTQMQVSRLLTQIMTRLRVAISDPPMAS